jgi:hypothetical protein
MSVLCSRASPLWKLISSSFRALYGAGLADRHAVPGVVVSIQTYGNLANWQPHLHALGSAGVVKREGVFTPLALPPASVAEPSELPIIAGGATAVSGSFAPLRAGG